MFIEGQNERRILPELAAHQGVDVLGAVGNADLDIVSDPGVLIVSAAERRLDHRDLRKRALLQIGKIICDGLHIGLVLRGKWLEELERRVASATNRPEVQETGVARLYPLEWDSVPYPKGFKVPTLHPFDGTKLAS